jgi:4-hydroxybenzoate polyprenyltransferase
VGLRSNLNSAVATIRWREAVIFQTPAVLGLAVFIPAISVGSAARALLACIGSFLSAASILAFNDWADISLDSQHSLKRHGTFVQRGLHPRQMLLLALALAAGGMIVFAFLSAPHVAAAFLAIVLGLAYSVPIVGLRGKSIPLFSSFLHFGGTLLSFLLGALTFAPDDWRGLLIAAHPAILLTAGHLVQEVEDYEEDRLSGCRTNAVRFGRTPVFVIAAVLFGSSFWLLWWLTAVGFFPPFVKYTAILYPVYLALALRAYRLGLTRATVRRLRDRYRVLFALVLVAMLLGSLLQRGLLA